MTSIAADRRTAAPPFWLALAAGLPIGVCMIVMALPVLGHGHATAYRVLYLVAFLAWSVPLTALQRALWRRGTAWWIAALVLLAVTYAMSVANNALGDLLAFVAGWSRAQPFEWTDLLRGLDSCWLALIAFCAIHAVVAHYAALQHEEARATTALALARDAELRALRYQLQPHFLFNTLNAISSLVAADRNRDARTMIARLGELLRATLDGAEGHEVALGEEIALTETYLDIEKARLGDKLALRWDIGPQVLGALVPHLLLQPLAENAIRHGIAQRSRPGRLDLRIRRDGARLRIAIGNDGDVRADAPTPPQRPSALGLKNIAERLAKLYPDDHAFAAYARPDGGFDVTIDLPYREQAPLTLCAWPSSTTSRSRAAASSRAWPTTATSNSSANSTTAPRRCKACDCTGRTSSSSTYRCPA